MRRISLWITATVAVIGLLIAYQANIEGGEQKTDRPGAGNPACAADIDPAVVAANPECAHGGKPGEAK